MAVHLPRARRRERQSSGRAGGYADQLRAHVRGSDEQLLRASARQPDLHHVGNGDASSAAGRSSWKLPRPVGAVQRRRLCRHALCGRCHAGPAVRAVGGFDARQRSDARPAKLCGSGQTERSGRAFHLWGALSGSFQFNHELRHGGRSVVHHPIIEGRTMNLLGKLIWRAVPFDQPIVMGASGGMILAIVLILSWITLKGYWPYLWREWITSVDHKRIGVMYIILALIMLLRGFSDAIMMRAQQAVATGGAQGYLPPEHFEWHDHDLLHGDAVRDRNDEFRGAAAARRP